MIGCANTLSQAKIVEASIAAVKLGMTGFIVPFMFVYEPSILLQGDIFGIITVVGFATLGVILLAAALQRFFYGKLEYWQAGLLFVGAICMIYPDWRVTVAGLVCTGLVLARQLTRTQSQPVAQAGE